MSCFCLALHIYRNVLRDSKYAQNTHNNNFSCSLANNALHSSSIVGIVCITLHVISFALSHLQSDQDAVLDV